MLRWSFMAALWLSAAVAEAGATANVVDLLGLNLWGHHLDQHPDRQCRVSWRPDSLEVRGSATLANAADIRATAMTFLGTPYRYGGVDAAGLDCSGFVNKVYAAHGYDLPRSSREQFRVGVRIPGDRWTAGDLLFFRGSAGDISHVGIYLGDDRFIHAVIGKAEVTTDLLSSTYYAARYAGARRILSLPPGLYSDLAGSARPGVLFADESSAASVFATGDGPCVAATW